MGEITGAEFAITDGVLRLASDPLFDTSNRGLLYGDGIFETLRMHRGKPLFAERHWQRMCAAMQAVGLIPQPGYTFETMLHEMDSLTRKNGLMECRTRISMIRRPGGLYKPDEMTPIRLVTQTNLQHPREPQNTLAIRCGIFEAITKPYSAVSAFKTISALPYVLGSMEAARAGYADMLVVNPHGHLTETLSGNLFFVFENHICTPPLSEGCVDGVMRYMLLELLAERSIRVRELPLTRDVLSGSTELWRTNVVSGITCIGAVNGREYIPGTGLEIARLVEETWYA